MSYTAQGIRASVVIHGAFVLLIMLLSYTVARERNIIVIDMGLVHAPGEAGRPAPAAQRTAPRPAVQPEALSHDAAPAPEPQKPADPETPVQEPGRDATGEGAAGGSSDAEGLRNTYLSEYFAYIRDRIVKNLAFPPTARKMGWTGRVTVSFVICRDGHVENIRIVQSTGFEVLDRNVVDAIKRVSPFPRAPVEAELTIPIVYKLL